MEIREIKERIWAALVDDNVTLCCDVSLTLNDYAQLADSHDSLMKAIEKWGHASTEEEEAYGNQAIMEAYSKALDPAYKTAFEVLFG